MCRWRLVLKREGSLSNSMGDIDAISRHECQWVSIFLSVDRSLNDEESLEQYDRGPATRRIGDALRRLVPVEKSFISWP